MTAAFATSFSRFYNVTTISSRLQNKWQ